ncbi:hypothetical protein BU24DRAFT_448405 [Aaosphaeria arxii CBS 175.79]|uniref:Uncharacterized protein n=1 Tax=Aaosphaeria arxii CBS 175.79 TaxID=1450172 RepID=A0A6A5Y4B8_9PLEO|nr:uncharacterized protein BU24DRAFT_448405 [Aaosphaeria arxii CBS 175.79]KAF2020043.1 hypothetical protein BU24DRAFT_448405 [Aaosphaeria arxii CBS 175.79]
MPIIQNPYVVPRVLSEDMIPKAWEPATLEYDTLPWWAIMIAFCAVLFLGVFMVWAFGWFTSCYRRCGCCAGCFDGLFKCRCSRARRARRRRAGDVEAQGFRGQRT